MANTILVAGGTGSLGKKIINELVNIGAKVHAVVRPESDEKKISALKEKGVQIFEANMSDANQLAEACKDVDCIVSALQGLKPVIVDVQTNLLHAAINAGVPRFIPSDFSLDFTTITSENRNFDLRRQFYKIIDESSINATSVFNGAFANILAYNIPILNIKSKTVGYWGNDADWKLDFTTMDDTAAFTAAAAMDDNTPRKLNIASFQISPNELVTLASEISQSPFKLVHMGSLEDFAAYNKQQRMANPESENEVFPKWQSGQYMHDMFSTHHTTLHNNRYAHTNWTNASEFISKLF